MVIKQSITLTNSLFGSKTFSAKVQTTKVSASDVISEFETEKNCSFIITNKTE